MKIPLLPRLVLGAACVVLNQTTAQTIEVTSTGVGIGTASPGTGFHVVGPFTSGYMQAALQASGSDNRSGLSFLNVAGSRLGYLYVANGGDFIFNRDQAGQFRFFSNGTERLTVDSSGNVGIGTTSPGRKLEVYSTTQNAHIAMTGSNVTGIRWQTTDVNPGERNWEILNNVDSQGTLSFRVGTAQTSAPSATRLAIDSSGNVGVGTTAPAMKFVVSNAGAMGLEISPTSMGSSVLIQSCDRSVNAYRGIRIDATNLAFLTNGSTTAFAIDGSGNVGIGTASPGYKLEVAGSVRATSFIANSNTYADFVFKPGYPLRSLSEVEAAIKAHGHLPDIPSEAEAKARGIDLAAMQVKLLQKVEELTLYLVAHDKELKLLRAENAALRHQISAGQKP